MGGFFWVSAIFSIAIFFVYPWGEFETNPQRIFKAIGMGSLIGLIALGLSHCVLGSGETEIYYRR